jgi:hypothetical protein
MQVFWHDILNLEVHSTVLKDCSGIIFRVRQSKNTLFLDCLALKMKALQCFKMLVTSYQSTWHNIPEDLNLQQHCCKNFIS